MVGVSTALMGCYSLMACIAPQKVHVTPRFVQCRGWVHYINIWSLPFSCHYMQKQCDFPITTTSGSWFQTFHLSELTETLSTTGKFVYLSGWSRDDGIAVDCKQYKERPHIGKLERVTPASVTIHWLIGTYSGVWKEWKKQGNNVSEEVDPENIVLPGITLTKSNRLHVP